MIGEKKSGNLSVGTWNDFVKCSLDYSFKEYNISLEKAKKDFERKLILLTLLKTNGDVKKAASLLEISFNELTNIIKALELENMVDKLKTTAQ